MRRLVLLAALLWPLTAPQAAHAPTATVDHWLHFWQAKRVVRWNAGETYRPDFRIERVRRVDGRTVRVCWSEPGYLFPEDGRDYGCDVVQLRGRQWWLRDGSVLGGVWSRKL